MGEAANSKKRDFPSFPFDPYPIQTDFMSFLYDSLDQGGVAMLESPTGTGKTLSIICSALQWLLDRRNLEPDPNPNDEDEPDWMRDFVATAAAPAKNKKGSLATKKMLGFGPENPKTNKAAEETVRANASDEEESEFLLDDYQSDEGSGSKRKGGFSSSSSDEEDEGKKGFFGAEEEVTPKVYFTSRTHSQLSQFVEEFRRTKFASEVNLVCLGSRKNMCINPEVSKLGSSNRINERCLELQKNRNDSKIKIADGRTRRTKASCCPMLRKQKLRELFKDKAQEHGALDIEDLVQLGRKIGTCPYYGSRDMVRAADLVVLPYQSLLLKSARESLGLNLKNNIVIIDEAHNLADSLTSMYNSKITLSQLKQVLSHLELYLDRFRIRLGAGNRRYIQTLIVLTKSFIRLMLGYTEDICLTSSCRIGQVCDENKSQDVSMTINELLFSLDIDNINLVKLHRYVKESNIIHKVSGYGIKLVNLENVSVHANSESLGAEGNIVSSFQALLDILISLVNNDSEGRIIISGQKSGGQIEEGSLKFVMLSGKKIFSEIKDQSHAVVMAGGTLQPIEETRERLFPSLPADQVHFFSCSHIVPPESILPITVACGPSGMTFDFSYNSRGSPCMIEELGRLVCNLVAVIPEGVVMFFSSFDYEAQVYDAWKASGFLPRILKKKHVFREPRNNMDVELVLREYRETIKSCGISGEDSGPNGALLLAVVGGKISEGINFSDGMGRCVIVVGLPYPSPSDVELMERVKHIEGLGEPSLHGHSKPLPTRSLYNGNAAQSGFDILRSCKQRGREYYENLCMKAVNQSIGRAIRHIDDYAAILLVDSRYSCNLSNRSFSNPIDRLPLWIKQRLVSNTKSYGEVHKLLHQFFKFNKQRGHS